jgi:transposase-like protein
MILCAVRRYLRYALSYRDKNSCRNGVCGSTAPPFRWVQRHAPEPDKRCRPCLRSTNNSYRVDETYIAQHRAINQLFGLAHNERALSNLSSLP